MEEYQIEELRQIVDEIDRELIVDKMPTIEKLRELVKLADDMRFEDVYEVEEKNDDFKDRLDNIWWVVDSLGDGINILETLQDELEKVAKALKILDLESKFNIEKFNNALEKINNAYYTIEQESNT